MTTTGIIYSLMALLPLSIAVINYRLLPRVLKWVAAFTFFSLFTEVTMSLLSKKGINNLFLIHIYVVVEYIVFGYVYAYYLNSIKLRKPIYITIVLFTAFSIFNVICLNGLKEFNTYGLLVEGALFIILSLLFFYKLFKDLEVGNLFTLPMFWINCAILIYFTANFMLFGLVELFPKEVGSNLWDNIHTTFTGVYSILMAIGLWKTRTV